MPESAYTDVFGQLIRVGQTVLYAGSGSASLRTATVIKLRERGGRPEILVKLPNERGTVSILHHPQRISVPRQSRRQQGGPMA
jgi:hypothetical protein